MDYGGHRMGGSRLMIVKDNDTSCRRLSRPWVLESRTGYIYGHPIVLAFYVLDDRVAGCTCAVCVNKFCTRLAHGGRREIFSFHELENFSFTIFMKIFFIYG